MFIYGVFFTHEYVKKFKDRFGLRAYSEIQDQKLQINQFVDL